MLCVSVLVCFVFGVVDVVFVLYNCRVRVCVIVVLGCYIVSFCFVMCVCWLLLGMSYVFCVFVCVCDCIVVRCLCVVCVLCFIVLCVGCVGLCFVFELYLLLPFFYVCACIVFVVFVVLLWSSVALGC